jgi:Zn finger protein HypA/HybF involved in hydrogenase expression
VTPQPLPKKTCPHCKAEIDELEYKRAIIECGTADTDGISRMIDYDSDEKEEEIVVFSCPSCHVALFTAEEDAVDFLSD